MRAQGGEERVRHEDDEPIRGQTGFSIVISSTRRTRFAAPCFLVQACQQILLAISGGFV